MDGFGETLRMGLKKASGDFTLYNRYGFFNFNDEKKQFFEKQKISTFSPYIQTEGFLILDGKSKGVRVRGVEGESFSKVNGINIKFSKQNAKPEIDFNQPEIILGLAIKDFFNLKKGDFISLAFGNGNKTIRSLPAIKRFKVVDFVEHGVYEKDSRVVYIQKDFLASILKVGQKVNIVGFNISNIIKENISSPEYLGEVKRKLRTIRGLENLGVGFVLSPFWREFSHLIEAVEVEKLTILIILQVIVIISIFNIFSFIEFLNERKSQELFLFQALGCSRKALLRCWYWLFFIVWSLSCLLSIFWIEIFDLALRNLSIFKLPGEVYNVGNLFIKLSMMHYLVVFLLALIWLMVLTFFWFLRLRRRSVLSGLRKEFA